MPVLCPVLPPLNSPKSCFYKSGKLKDEYLTSKQEILFCYIYIKKIVENDFLMLDNKSFYHFLPLAQFPVLIGAIDILDQRADTYRLYNNTSFWDPCWCNTGWS